MRKVIILCSALVFEFLTCSDASARVDINSVTYVNAKSAIEETFTELLNIAGKEALQKRHQEFSVLVKGNKAKGWKAGWDGKLDISIEKDKPGNSIVKFTDIYSQVHPFGLDRIKNFLKNVQAEIDQYKATRNNKQQVLNELQSRGNNRVSSRRNSVNNLNFEVEDYYREGLSSNGSTRNSRVPSRSGSMSSLSSGSTRYSSAESLNSSDNEKSKSRSSLSTSRLSSRSNSVSSLNKDQSFEIKQGTNLGRRNSDIVSRLRRSAGKNSISNDSYAGMSTSIRKLDNFINSSDNTVEGEVDGMTYLTDTLNRLWNSNEVQSNKNTELSSDDDKIISVARNVAIQLSLDQIGRGATEPKITESGVEFDQFILDRALTKQEFNSYIKEALVKFYEESPFTLEIPGDINSMSAKKARELCEGYLTRIYQWAGKGYSDYCIERIVKEFGKELQSNVTVKIPRGVTLRKYVAFENPGAVEAAIAKKVANAIVRLAAIVQKESEFRAEYVMSTIGIVTEGAQDNTDSNWSITREGSRNSLPSYATDDPYPNNTQGNIQLPSTPPNQGGQQIRASAPHQSEVEGYSGTTGYQRIYPEI